MQIARPLRRHTSQPLLILCFIAASCIFPSEPHDPNRMRLGQLFDGTVAAGETRELALEVKAGEAFTIYVRAPDAGIRVEVQAPGGSLIAGVLHPGSDTASMRYFTSPVLADSTRRYAIRVRAANSGSATFALRPVLIESRPERVAARIAVGAEVTGEGIQHPLDLDEFTFELASPQTVIAFLQSDAPPGGVSMRLGELGSLVSSFAHSGTMGAPESGSTGRTTLPAGTHSVLVYGNSGGAPPTAAYRLHLRAVDFAPERAAPVLVPGDTLSTEQIDHLGDVDEFTLRGAPGQEYNIFTDVSGVRPHAIEVRVGTSGPGVSAAVDGPALLDNPSGRFAMPAAGEVRVTVVGMHDRDAGFRGPYRLFVLPVDPRPEGRGGDIVPDGTVITSALEVHGDVDEFHFRLDAPRRISLRSPVMAEGLVIQLATAGEASPFARDVLLPGGAHRVRVHSTGTPSGYRGPYTFTLSAVDTVAEGVPAALAIGDTVRATAAWPWDIDSYEVTVPRADTIVAALDAPYDPLRRVVVTMVDLATGAAVPLSPPHILDYMRVALPAGRYAARVEWRDERWAPGSEVAYGLTLRRVSAAPETHPGVLAMGDTAHERFEFLGDIDDFTLQGPPGQLLNFGLGDPNGFMYQLLPSLTVTDAASGERLGQWIGYRPSQHTTPVRMPAGGAVRLRVCSLADCSTSGHLGAYWLVPFPIDPAPESRPASFAVGDTVQGEAIERPGDVDEFTFTGAAGARISASFAMVPMGGDPVRLEIVDAHDGAVLGYVERDWTMWSTPTSQLMPVTLPRTGTYVVRVWTPPRYDRIDGHGPYRFWLTAQ